jgi:hypothetical protein
MSEKDLVRIGSETAKGGFANEDAVKDKFNSWKKDKEAQKWLVIMGYNLKKIKDVKAIRVHGHKTDVHVKILVALSKAISIQNLSVKKANDDADYNQIDKRKVDKYVTMWKIPNKIATSLKIFSGEIKPKELLSKGLITKEKYNSLKDKRRFFLNEFGNRAKDDLLRFFKENKMLVVSDVIKGNGAFAADWMLVTKYNVGRDETAWVLADINRAMNVFSQGEVIISPRGSLHIGRITLQRKGGDGGRDTANMLQFKISPCELFK